MTDGFDRNGRRTHRRRLTDAACGAALLGFVIGCKEDPRTTALPSSTVSKKTAIGLNVNDRPLETRAILAVGTKGESSWRVTVATHAVSCDALRKSYPDRPAVREGSRIDFWLVRPMNPDGSHGAWSIRSSFITDKAGGRGMLTRGVMVEDVSSTGEIVKMRGLDLAATDRETLVQFTGAALAKNCGRVALPGQALSGRDAAVSQGGAAADRDKKLTAPNGKLKDSDETTVLPPIVMTLAGMPYRVGGATIRPIGKNYHLRLSRAPQQCESVFTEGYDSFLDIALTGAPPAVVFASLSGDVFPDSPSGSKDKDQLSVTASDTLDGTTAIPVTLKGAFDVGGFAVTLDGTVNALRCMPKPLVIPGN